MKEDNFSSFTKYALSDSYQSLLLEYIRGDKKSLNPKFALYGSKNKCARTDIIFFPLSEICTRVVTLLVQKWSKINPRKKVRNVWGGDLFVSVLLSAHVKTFSVSCMRDCFVDKTVCTEGERKWFHPHFTLVSSSVHHLPPCIYRGCFLRT